MVTVIVPMLNEAGYIEPCLQSFAEQTYPKDLLDVVVVDGGSTDGSRAVVESLAETRPWLRIVDNPRRKASAAFNRGVEAAKGDVICLFSAHGVATADYVERSVAVLQETGAAGVGGRYRHVGLDPIASAIGLAMVSPFGMASRHRFSTARVEVDTISHPAYRRDALVGVGPFDETLERNSDYELNWRIREQAERLVLDPTIDSIYRPRGSLRALGRQFWWYGRWKFNVASRHPRSVRPRHLVAPAAVAFALFSLLARGDARVRRLGRAVGAAYALADVLAVVQARPREADASPMVLAAAFPTMHASWGAGFLWSAIEWARKRGRPW